MWLLLMEKWKRNSQWGGPRKAVRKAEWADRRVGRRLDRQPLSGRTLWQGCMAPAQSGLLGEGHFP